MSISAPWKAPIAPRAIVALTPPPRAERVRSGGSLTYAYAYRKLEPYTGERLRSHVESLEARHARGEPITDLDLCWLPRADGLAWWNRTEVYVAFTDWALRTMVAVFDVAALDAAFVRIAAGAHDPKPGPNFGPNAVALDGLAQVDSVRVAPIMAAALRHEERADERARAGRWLLKCAETAAVALIPVAVGVDGVAQEDAAGALVWMARRGADAVVRAVAASYGAAATAAVAAIVEAWPSPAKAPTLPKYLKGVVPDALATAVLTFAAWPPELIEVTERVAGQEIDAEVEDPLVLEELWKVHRVRVHPSVTGRDDAVGVAMVEAWIAAKAPAKDAWVVFAAAVLGGAGTIAAIARAVAAVPAARATIALDALAHAGARAELAAIAAQPKPKPVAAHAAYLLRRGGQGHGHGQGA